MLKNRANLVIEIIAGHPGEIRGLADIGKLRRIAIIVLAHDPGSTDVRHPLRWFGATPISNRDPVRFARSHALPRGA